ncbi:hypothetical protein BpHYR1_010332 [Brachionus plicatilis]|uniref:Uncharacterized protein n=1 Tax=Brachionus plicatilis TaxID=10195 RepID=A0A3M7T938_BRAPC|nr:hypothetical protein BpHYR1_010332 [Brachionus plicatilis]
MHSKSAMFQIYFLKKYLGIKHKIDKFKIDIKSFIIKKLIKNTFLFKSKTKNFDLKFTFDHELQFAYFHKSKDFDLLSNLEVLKYN